MEELITDIDPSVMEGCLGKTPFKTRGAAQSALKRIIKRGRIYPEKSQYTTAKIEVYKCKNCEFFHHGHELSGKRKFTRNRRMH